MKIKIKGGTVYSSGDETLCTSCRNAVIMSDGSMRHTQILCCEVPYGNSGAITFPVKSCTSYDHKNTPTIQSYYDTAWILRTDENSKQIGFVPYKSLSDDEKDRL